MKKHSNKKVTNEREVVDSLYSYLSGSHSPWSVERQPQIGSSRPDLVVRDPAGHALVIEVKLGPGASHIGSLAWMSSFLSDFKQASGDEGAIGVLVTDQTPESSLAQAADDLGIRLLKVSADEPVTMATHVAGELHSLFET